jgi:PAS domain S-box-containing protein
MNATFIHNQDAQFFLEMLAASNSSIVITDARAQDNPIIFVNPAFEELTGYSAADAVGKNCRFLQGGDRRQSVRKIIAKTIVDGAPSECVIRNYKKNGELFWNKFYIFPLKDPIGKIKNYVGIQHDVTAERQLLAELEEKNRLIETATDVYLKISRNLIILEANAACFAVFGWPPEQLIGKSASCLVPQSRLARTACSTTMQAAWLPHRRNGEYVRSDGNIVYVEWVSLQSLSTDALLLMGRDVSALRRAEAEAARASAINASLMKNISEGYFSVDRDWNFTYINMKAARFLRRMPGSLLGKNIWEEFPSEVGGTCHIAFRRALELGVPQRCGQSFLGKWLVSRAYPSGYGLDVFVRTRSRKPKEK